MIEMCGFSMGGDLPDSFYLLFRKRIVAVESEIDSDVGCAFYFG